MTRYAFHPEALNDIDNIWKFIAQNSLDAASRVVDEIHEAIRSLVKTPRQGHCRCDLTSRQLRFWRVRIYLIVYSPDDTPLTVIAILHGRRNPKVLSRLLRGRYGPI